MCAKGIESGSISRPKNNTYVDRKLKASIHNQQTPVLPAVASYGTQTLHSNVLSSGYPDLHKA